MEEISTIIPSDIDHFLENEKFDFDLPFSPTLLEVKVVEGKTTDDDDEVFFGPVGFTEQCMSTRVTTLHDDTTIKPLSPLSGEQVVELFTEATKIALHLERLSTETLETSLNQSHANSSKSSMSNSYLKLSNCSSSSSLSQLSVGKLSSGSSEGKPGSQSDLIDNDKENVQPMLKSMEKLNEKNESERVDGLKGSHVTPLASKHNTPVAKSKRCLPRPGSRTSRLPKSKNTEKSLSAFSSPIKTLGHDHSNGTVISGNLETCNNVVQGKGQSVDKSESRRSQYTTKNSVPNNTTAATTKARKSSLTKRNIFRSTDSLTEDETKETKSKLPVLEQSKIPGPKPRRRRSSSTSSVSSQSSTSSSKSHSALDENQSIKPTRLTKQIPSTKASLASSLPIGLIRRSKAQENATNDKKPQPMKALPRSATKTSKNSKIEPPSSHLSRSLMRPPSDEIKEDKIPLAATPQSQSSSPVARRRSSIKRPSVSSIRSSGSTPRRNSSSLTTDSQTPNRTNRKTELTLASQKRRSFIPTPGRNVQTPNIKRISRNSSEDPPISLSPATKLKKESSQEPLEPSQKPLEPPQEPLEHLQEPLEPSQKPLEAPQEPLEHLQEPLEHLQEPFLKMNDEMFQDDQHCISTCLTSAQSVDDLLQLDDIASCISDVIPIQPKPVPQPDLIDLSGI